MGNRSVLHAPVVRRAIVSQLACVYRADVPPPALDGHQCKRSRKVHDWLRRYSRIYAAVLPGGASALRALGLAVHGRIPMKVRDAMHKGVDWVSPYTPLVTIARMMRDQDIGAIPVGDNDRLVGMITDRDIALRVVADGADPTQLCAGDVMSKGIVYCRDDENVIDAVRIMESSKVRRLAVIDDHKRMVGILSLGDVSHASSQLLTGEVTRAVSGHHA
jgi:CBS domain-containing protein